MSNILRIPYFSKLDIKLDALWELSENYDYDYTKTAFTQGLDNTIISIYDTNWETPMGKNYRDLEFATEADKTLFLLRWS